MTIPRLHISGLIRLKGTVQGYGPASSQYGELFEIVLIAQQTQLRLILLL